MRRLRTLFTLRVNESVAWRVAEQLEPLEARLAQQAEDLRRLREDLDRRLGGTDRRIDAVQRQADWSANELARLAPQAASFEARLEQKARPVVLTGALEDLPESRLLVDVVREEHARVRARLSLVSAYEERLRRLEDQAAARASS